MTTTGFVLLPSQVSPISRSLQASYRTQYIHHMYRSDCTLRHEKSHTAGLTAVSPVHMHTHGIVPHAQHVLTRNAFHPGAWSGHTSTIWAAAFNPAGNLLGAQCTLPSSLRAQHNLPILVSSVHSAACSTQYTVLHAHVVFDASLLLGIC